MRRELLGNDTAAGGLKRPPERSGTGFF